MDKFSVHAKKAQAYIDRDKAVTSPSYTRAAPFVMDHGAGSEIWDIDDNRLIDIFLGIAVCATDHSHPVLVEAIKQQAERFLHISSNFYHLVWIELSERFASIALYKDSADVALEIFEAKSLCRRAARSAMRSSSIALLT